MQEQLHGSYTFGVCARAHPFAVSLRGINETNSKQRKTERSLLPRRRRRRRRQKLLEKMFMLKIVIELADVE